jgi:hypothetical protein
LVFEFEHGALPLAGSAVFLEDAIDLSGHFSGTRLEFSAAALLRHFLAV